MFSDLFFEIPQGWFFVLTVLLLFGAAECGFRIGRRSLHAHEKLTAHVGTLEGAILGLLALLLGFAFSMTMGRFDEQKKSVLAEANDIGTAYLRSKLLPPSMQQETQKLLKEYLSSRIALYKCRAHTEEEARQADVSRKIQEQLWQQIVEITKSTHDEVTIGYYVEALNQVIDDHARRMAAFQNHLPNIIFVLLFFVAIMSLALTGYSSGLHGVRLPIPRLILALLISATLMVIVDLDRPRRGLIQVSEQALTDLQISL